MKTLKHSELTLPPLHQAARQRDVKTARSLIFEGADIHELSTRQHSGEGGNTPLWFAAQGLASGGVAIAQLLLEAGADVNAQGEFGTTPLHVACSWGHPDMAIFLHEQGADLDIKDDYGRTAACLARADYEEAKAAPNHTQPVGCTIWLEGLAEINRYFDSLIVHRTLTSMREIPR